MSPTSNSAMKGDRVVKQGALPSTLWSMGLAGALAAAAMGLWMIFGAGRTVAEVPTAPPASVTAPAEALGKAFAAVAARVKPAVVSVYSERLVRVQRPEIPFPFGDDFLRQFFGQGLPQLQPGAGSSSERIPERGMGQAIRDANELESVVAKAKEQILLLIKRKNASIYVVLQAK